jgi:uncharacterized protein (DUF433 family)
MIPAELTHVLNQDERVMSGAICFVGTRIPVQILLDNHRAGFSIETILENYPDLTREHVQAVLNWEDEQARRALGLELVS